MEVEISLADLHAGLSRGEFIYFYQPIFSLVSGRICGAEALLRWRTPEGTLCSPAAFIPLAEETGFISEITHFMHPHLIAEGIENDELYNLTLSTGCTAAQGYYFSYPLPLAEFCALVEQKPRWNNYPFGLEYLAQVDHIDFRRDVIRGALTLYTTSDEAIRQRVLERLPLLGVDECLLAEWYNGVGQEWNAVPGFAELG